MRPEGRNRSEDTSSAMCCGFAEVRRRVLKHPSSPQSLSIDIARKGSAVLRHHSGSVGKQLPGQDGVSGDDQGVMLTRRASMLVWRTSWMENMGEGHSVES
eukprot:EG_transcript_66664